MNRLDRFKPTKGFSRFFHFVLVGVIPILTFVLVRLYFVPLAYAVVLLSKWRMLAVRPRHWPANVRANAIDIIVGLSFVTFIAHSPSQAWQVIWAISYGVWLIAIKPRSSVFWNTIQAGIGQFLGLVAMYIVWGRSSLLLLVLASWGICYLAARHFLGAFDEPHNSLLAHIWGYFGAALTWVLGHWLLYYGFLSQPTLLLGIISTGVAALYYLESNDKLSTLVRREIILIMTAVIVVIILFSNWSDRTV